MDRGSFGSEDVNPLMRSAAASYRSPCILQISWFNTGDGNRQSGRRVFKQKPDNKDGISHYRSRKETRNPE